MVGRRDVERILSSENPPSGRELEIPCDTVKAIQKRDMVELFLLLRGARRWKWVDTGGRFLAGQSLPVALSNVFRDFLLLPFIYLEKMREITRLGRKIGSGAKDGYAEAHRDGSPPRSGTLPTVLFMRTDHWFNVKSGGSVGHLSGVIHGLRALGYLTHVVSTDYLALVEADENFHLCEPEYELGRNLPVIPVVLYNEQLMHYVGERWAKWSPAVVYQRYSLGNYTGVLLKQRYGVPYVCEYNGSFTWMARHWDGKKLPFEGLLNRIELLNLKAADVIVVVSQAMQVELAGRGIDPGKVLVNPNGVNHEVYSPGVDGSGIRDRYGLDGKIVIGFIGTFGLWHGAEVLAEAFGQLLRHNPGYRERVRLLMVGDGNTMPQVKESLRKFDVMDLCTLTGLVPQEQGAGHLAACDILVSPHVPNPDGTPFFGSPTKLFEYMAMGKGIVASDLDQIGKILGHNHTAWLVEPGDSTALMEGLKVLVEDERLRARLGQAARQEVVQKYTWIEHTRRIMHKLAGRVVAPCPAHTQP